MNKTPKATAAKEAAVPLVRTECTQAGLSAEFSVDNGIIWQHLLLHPYKDRSRKNWGRIDLFIDPAKDEQDFYDHLTSSGARYRRQDCA